MSGPHEKSSFGFFNTPQQDIAELSGVFVVQPQVRVLIHIWFLTPPDSVVGLTAGNVSQASA